ncbi:MAG: hypothetical protein IJ529_03050 [Alphaproteobacteria bacterium]|nr:hypothetical protein [Alphaproteobacteria bacterium]MBR1649413.1 hypothetical protein [Alphaproteobacteria bacterium]
MINDLKILTLLAGMAILSAIVRAKNFAQACIDAVLGFIMGYSLYLVFDMFDISEPAKCGCACVVVIFARPLYDTLNNFIVLRLCNLITARIEKHE